jgi:ketosteroid isomerase-like protein
MIHMKKTFMILSMAVWAAACNNQPAESPVTEAPKAEAAPPKVVSHPYTATYSSDFSIGDPELVNVVLNMYKDLEANRLDSLGKYFADSVHWRNYAEADVTLTREGMVSKIKGFRGRFKEFSETPVAFTALHAKDKNEDWVLTWIKERVTYANGKKDSTTYHETWRVRDGKIFMHDSYAKFRQ